MTVSGKFSFKCPTPEQLWQFQSSVCTSC